MITREELINSLEELLESESQDGCSEDLTVVSKEACDNLQELLDRINNDEEIEN